MVAAIRTSVLLAILASAARCEEYDDGLIIEEYTDPCDEDPRLPSIAALTSSNESYLMGDKYFALHGEDIALQCSSTNAANLVIQFNEENLLSNKLNNTSIESSIKKPDVGEYEYRCTDSQSGCGTTLNIIVEPVLSVSSPNVKLKLNEQGERVYFVPFSDDFEVFCSGNDFRTLKIYMISYPLDLQTETVNKTTIKYAARAEHIGKNHYYCEESESRGIEVIVDYYPQAKHFQCISYQWRKLECSWTSSSKKNSFKLFEVVLHDGLTTILCAFNSGEISRVCTTYDIMNSRNGILQLQTCNEVFCDNEIFVIDLRFILKLDPPSYLKLLSTSSHAAVIGWYNPEDVFTWACDFKIEYRLLAKKWQRANASSVPCDGNDCEFKLFLACPDAHYEVKVYVKLKLAKGDKFWSEPASLYFFTAPGNPGDVMDPSCHAALQEPEPITSAETGVNEVGKLIRHTIKEKSKLKEIISVMHQKLAKFKALAELLAATRSKITGQT